MVIGKSSFDSSGYALDVSGEVQIVGGLDVSGYLKLPFGSDDVSSATYEGYIRYNDASNVYQGYDASNNVWSSLGKWISGSTISSKIRYIELVQDSGLAVGATGINNMQLSLLEVYADSAILTLTTNMVTSPTGWNGDKTYENYLNGTNSFMNTTGYSTGTSILIDLIDNYTMNAIVLESTGGYLTGITINVKSEYQETMFTTQIPTGSSVYRAMIITNDDSVLPTPDPTSEFVYTADSTSEIVYSVTKHIAYDDGDVLITGGVLDVSGDINTNSDLNVDGTAYASGSALTSDDRLKHNEQDISGLELITQLHPQKYLKTRMMYAENYTLTEDASGEYTNLKQGDRVDEEMGIIAQDVLNIPELSFCVTDSTPYAVNYNNLFVLSIQAIKELKAKNDALQTTITQLTSRIEALENASTT